MKPNFLVLCAMTNSLSRAEERKRMRCSTRVVPLQGFLFGVAKNGHMHYVGGMTVHSCWAVRTDLTKLRNLSFLDIEPR